MGSLSIWHWIIVLLVVMVLFGGRGKISNLMGDFAQGIKAFKKGMAEDDKQAGGEGAGQDHRGWRQRGGEDGELNGRPRAYAPECCRGGVEGVAGRCDLSRGGGRLMAAPWS